jgi:pimeloyl-ACP methyl ester carboxylesterase
MQVSPYNGVGLHVRELGSGPPLVLVHGIFPGNMATWYLTAAPALAQRHRVVLYDFRGHGFSARAASGYDIPTMARDLEAVLEEHVGEPAVVAGYSYGGVVAMACALRRPDLVSKLVVLEGPLPPSTQEEFPSLDEQARKDPGELFALLPQFVRDALVPGSRRARRFEANMHYLVYDTTLYEDIRQAQDFLDTELARLQPPLLAIYGLDSKINHAGHRLARVVPGARLLELPGDHYLLLSVADRVSAAIEAFADG